MEIGRNLGKSMDTNDWQLRNDNSKKESRTDLVGAVTKPHVQEKSKELIIFDPSMSTLVNSWTLTIYPLLQHLLAHPYHPKS